MYQARIESKANQQDSQLPLNSGTRGRRFKSSQARHSLQYLANAVRALCLVVRPDPFRAARKSIPRQPHEKSVADQVDFENRL